MAQAILDFWESSHHAVEYESSPEKKKLKTDIILEKECSKILKISNIFPKQPTNDFEASQLEYRVKLLNSESASLKPGESRNITTNVLISKKPNKLAMHVKKPENQDFAFHSEGFINPQTRGFVIVNLENRTREVVYLPKESIVGYLILTPYLIC